MARALAYAGAQVVLSGRDVARLTAVRDAFRADGLATWDIGFDVTDPQAVALARIEAEIGPIEIPVNNAGTQHRAPLGDYPLVGSVKAKFLNDLTWRPSLPG